MPQDFDRNTLAGAAARRAAEAMLRARGTTIVLRLPRVSEEENAGLGLVPPLTEDVALAPAAVRPLAGDEPRYEFTVAAEAVQRQMELRNYTSADDFFAAALGIVQGARLLRIERHDALEFGGVACLHRLLATG